MVKKKKKILQLEGRSDQEKKQVIYELQAYLHLQYAPIHIECFDNSHFQGSYPVSAMVCFKDGVPSKADYRHYNVKTVTGIDDFATMREVVFRRYRRLKEEGSTLPQLVIIDGGKGQLNAAMDSIKALGLEGAIHHFDGLIAKAGESIPDCNCRDMLKQLVLHESERLVPKSMCEDYRKQAALVKAVKWA